MMTYIYSVYLHKKIYMLSIIEIIHQQHQIYSLFLIGLSNYYWRFLGFRNQL